jgi:ankyrin repeat protein
MQEQRRSTRSCGTAGRASVWIIAVLILISAAALVIARWPGRTAPAGNKAISHPVDLAAQTKRRDEARRWSQIDHGVATDDPKALADLEAQGVEVNAPDWAGNTALLMAASNSSVHSVEYLVAHGADVNARNKQNVTALDQAVRSDSQPIIKLLLDKGAHLDICAAAALGRRDDVSHMLAQDPKLLDYKMSGNPPLFWAARAGQAAVVQALLDAGADVNTRNAEGETALLMAVEGKSPAAAAVLLEKGANTALTANRAGLTPLDEAQSVDMMDLLIAHGAKVDSWNGRGQTALQWQVSLRQPDLVSCLIGHGADVNAQDGNGDTPLHEAAKQGGLKEAQLLVGKGAALDIKDKSDLTPLDVARKAGHADVAEFLSQAAAGHEH